MGRSSVSYNKKELEKKRAQKRKDKQNRKEERKANGGSGLLDDMIAYVDENGMITNEQPIAGKKGVIDAKKIAISTPKKDDSEHAALKGRVEYFNQDKGYGFIKDLGSTEKYFFHIKDAFQNINEGSNVNFELARGNRGLNAIKIIPA